MPRRAKRGTNLPAKASYMHTASGHRHPVGWDCSEAWCYLYVPRDQRHAAWHKAHWWSVPEWARDRDDGGVFRVDIGYADVAISVLRAYYPEAAPAKP